MTIASIIEQKLRNAFQPTHLAVINESNNHNVPPGSESHFKVVIVADAFNEQRLIKRHRLVNNTLAEELAEKIHALASHTYTEIEWQKQNAENYCLYTFMVACTLWLAAAEPSQLGCQRGPARAPDWLQV